MKAFGNELAWHDCYSLVILAIRLAIKAARDRDVLSFRAGLLLLDAGISKIDRRDGLRAMSVFENCSARLGLNLHDEWCSVAGSEVPGAPRSVANAYFARSDDMRSIDVMGIVEVGSGETLTFKNKYF